MMNRFNLLNIGQWTFTEAQPNLLVSKEQSSCWSSNVLRHTRMNLIGVHQANVL